MSELITDNGVRVHQVAPWEPVAKRETPMYAEVLYNTSASMRGDWVFKKEAYHKNFARFDQVVSLTRDEAKSMFFRFAENERLYDDSLFD